MKKVVIPNVMEMCSRDEHVTNIYKIMEGTFS